MSPLLRRSRGSGAGDGPEGQASGPSGAGRSGRRRSRVRLTRTQVGIVTAVVVAALAYLCYTKFANPFASHFTVEATFQDANGLLPGSPVRIAGVDVGSVTGVTALYDSAGSTKSAAEVTMHLDRSALPLHTDATFDIRPRIFLEGNFFVDLHPGSPSAPTIKSGYVYPVSAGVEPVQLDQLLTSLQASTRMSLQTLIQQYGEAVKEGGPSYNASIQYWLPAYKYSSEVSHDFLGTQPNDLATVVAKGATVSAAVDRYPEDLQNLISSLDSAAGAFASERTDLAATIQNLAGTLSAANPTFDAVDAALPKLDTLAKDVLPGVKTAGPASTEALPLITQLRDLVQPSELQGLSKSLSATVPSLARLTKATIPLLSKEVRPASSCVVNNIYPWSQLSINDGTTNEDAGEPVRKVFQEAVDYLPGLAGESRNFDANGPYIRVLLTGGSLTYSLSEGMFGQAVEPITAVQPQLPSDRAAPPLEPGTACETQSAITESGLQSKPGGQVSSVSTNLDAPGATLRWADAVVAGINEIKQTASQDGVPVDLSSGLISTLTGLLQQGLSGVPNASQILTKTLASLGTNSDAGSGSN